MYTSEGGENSEIVRVTDPDSLRTASQPTFTNDIGKVPRFHVQLTCNNILLKYPQVEADTIIQYPKTADDPLTNNNNNPNIPVISQDKEDKENN